MQTFTAILAIALFVTIAAAGFNSFGSVASFNSFGSVASFNSASFG
eukprot:CAMPEP_0116962098 /NCGR_PEP_ID=MMETSP0467-20121206/47026_1 /TAXON_ID=283647 /ORGANISM="Mesodinium pulex, Strain SPMC105" /LENGTH=45 /DNA_ID= /DNA_START= /DNA_END= /DNA_ORIENTATION=